MMGTVLGVKLSQCRKGRYLSQRALAAEADVSFATVKAIEAGKVKKPQLRIVKKIADALGVQAAEIDEFRHALELDPPGD